jgi:hypothetical protein
VAVAAHFDAAEIHFHSVDPGRQGRVQFDGPDFVEHQELDGRFQFGQQRGIRHHGRRYHWPFRRTRRFRRRNDGQGNAGHPDDGHSGWTDFVIFQTFSFIFLFCSVFDLNFVRFFFFIFATPLVSQPTRQLNGCCCCCSVRPPRISSYTGLESETDDDSELHLNHHHHLSHDHVSSRYSLGSFVAE